MFPEFDRKTNKISIGTTVGLHQTRTISCIVFLLLISGCGGYAAHTYPPLTAEDFLTKVISNNNFKIIDGVSFSKAQILYPARITSIYHIIPVGDYLLAKTTLALPERSNIEQLRLNSFNSTCMPSQFIAPEAKCVTSVIITLIIHGAYKNIAIKDEVDAGPLFIAGDFAPPFTWGDMLNEPIRIEAQKVIDSLQMKMHDNFVKILEDVE